MMDNRLKQLEEKYPDQINCLYECDVGWIPLIEQMMAELERTIPQEKFQYLRINTIKEKFGELRVYTDYEAPHSEDGFGYWEDVIVIINRYTDLSRITCERCGEAARRVELTNWVETLCDDHIVNKIKTAVFDSQEHDGYQIHSKDGHNFIALDELDETDRWMFSEHVRCIVHPPFDGTEYVYFFNLYMDMKNDAAVLGNMESNYLKHHKQPFDIKEDTENSLGL